MTTHTPGPWTVAKYRPNSGQPFIVVVDAPSPSSGRPIAVVQGTPEAANNADLIAAAPDLLAASERAMRALQGFLISCDGDEREDSFGDMNAACMVAGAAIAKARGTE